MSSLRFNIPLFLCDVAGILLTGVVDLGSIFLSYDTPLGSFLGVYNLGLGALMGGLFIGLYLSVVRPRIFLTPLEKNARSPEDEQITEEQVFQPRPTVKLTPRATVKLTGK